MKTKTYSELESLVNNRLMLQSTERGLAVYGLNCKSFNDILKPSFTKTLNKLAAFQRKAVLIHIAGPLYWRQLSEIVDKINR